MKIALPLRVTFLTFVAAALAAPRPAAAAFHLWEIVEVYSNQDGTIQYIELSTTSAGQGFVDGHDITATSDGVEHTFTFPDDVAGDTTNKTLLLATPLFGTLTGAVAPDFTLPCGPFFEPDAADIEINFVGADAVTFEGADLPADSADSLHFTVAGVLSVSANNPRDFAGVTGDLALSACEFDGSCDLCDDGLFCNGLEACTDGACETPGDPCVISCDEATDTCINCLDPSDCDDSNECTDDACAGGLCSNADNVIACDDGLFCTATDTCAGGECVGAGDACPGTNCNEGTDICAACLVDGDCEDGDPCIVNTCGVSGDCETADAAPETACADDGLFCTGAESCAAGVCVGEGNPCEGALVCSEDDDLCRGCGDGRLDAGEVCDDGDSDDGDGCSAACAVEDGFVCDVDVEPSVCAPDEDPDAGPDSDADTDGDTDTDADTDTGSPDAGTSSPPKKDGGCGCSATPVAGGGWMALVAVLGILRSRRRT